MPKRMRRFNSKKDELIKKSREAMLAATQIYNNPLITFKSESFITLSVIAWTYLLHAYYQKIGVDYRRKIIDKESGKETYKLTKKGAEMHWELETCLNHSKSPIDNATKTNLIFLIGIRHEIEHQMTNCIDEQIGAKLHACALNFNYYIKNLFGDKYGMDKELSLSISFAEIDPTKAKKRDPRLNQNVQNYIADFETSLSDDVSKDKRYAYRILYVPICANRKGQADKVIEFENITDEQAEQIRDIVVFKDREKPKYKPKKIVEIMKNEGYLDFTIYKHTVIWKELQSKGVDLSRYGTQLSDGSWYWYENWLDQVKDYCEEHYKRSN